MAETETETAELWGEQTGDDMATTAIDLSDAIAHLELEATADAVAAEDLATAPVHVLRRVMEGVAAASDKTRDPAELVDMLFSEDTGILPLVLNLADPTTGNTGTPAHRRMPSCRPALWWPPARHHPLTTVPPAELVTMVKTVCIDNVMRRIGAVETADMSTSEIAQRLDALAKTIARHRLATHASELVVVQGLLERVMHTEFQQQREIYAEKLQAYRPNVLYHEGLEIRPVRSVPPRRTCRVPSLRPLGARGAPAG